MVWLLDVRHEPSKDDLEIQELLIASGRPVLVALTKGDKLTRVRPGGPRRATLAAALGLQEDQVQLTSSTSRQGIAELGQSILATVGGDRMRTFARAVARAWTLLALCSALRRRPGRTEAVPRTPLPPAGYGSLTQSDLALGIATPELEIRLVPLDQRVTRLLARDTYGSLRAWCSRAAPRSTRWPG